ncbi:MAG: hypothetical protein QM621_14875 [Aeromicrobium sp.]|uniref:hypothetical protein n=1 Tax=Aeromicrobium sp. TaxID=1871063 RepID=UPI0039E51F54
MSRAEVRDALAEAASSVDGVDVSPYFAGVTAPGAGFVRWDRSEQPNPFGFVGYWNVVVLLPQDLAAAEQMADELFAPLTAALAPHMRVTGAQMQQLTIPGVGVLPCVFINGHRED